MIQLARNNLNSNTHNGRVRWAWALGSRRVGKGGRFRAGALWNRPERGF